MREGFARLDAGELDAFELDELIHRYKRSTCELWKFCNLSSPEGAAWVVADARERYGGRGVRSARDQVATVAGIDDREAVAATRSQARLVWRLQARGER